ncbi:putative ABC transporter ATP-binding protein YbbL [Providencia sneebia DSM 19967]|uniref:Putative ABC transporter ATP-binding protein YbbL n=1 Tax=Providencia sneebia DSM 19967 TaxID=1141660 RepID=K8WMF4_9GAMM|nr:putative ABC transporter ATP-binding protein YbbL [Providencia sneebia DSM 19967]
MDQSLTLLQVENVGYVIDDKTILQNVKFNLSSGEFKLITGPSGCGKVLF